VRTEPRRQAKAEILQHLDLNQPAAAAAPVMRQQEARVAAVAVAPDFLLHQELQLDIQETFHLFLLLKETMVGLETIL
jgi:hypothetical protein